LIIAPHINEAGHAPAERKEGVLIQQVETTSAGAMTSSMVVAEFERTLPGNFTLRGNRDGIESRLVGFLESNAPADKETWFNFDRLTFATNSAQLDMERSRNQLTNIAEILKAFPKAKLKIGGYTDNTGDALVNRKLSAERAANVKAAIEGLGIEASRLEAEGYGQEHPVATNDTEEGRAQNRRIAVRVMEK
jgi:K(+)-stimulated pyrophosphate-energized sodium pump